MPWTEPTARQSHLSPYVCMYLCIINALLSVGLLSAASNQCAIQFEKTEPYPLSRLWPWSFFPFLSVCVYSFAVVSMAGWWCLGQALGVSFSFPLLLSPFPKPRFLLPLILSAHSPCLSLSCSACC